MNRNSILVVVSLALLGLAVALFFHQFRPVLDSSKRNQFQTQGQLTGAIVAKALPAGANVVVMKPSNYYAPAIDAELAGLMQALKKAGVAVARTDTLFLDGNVDVVHDILTPDQFAAIQTQQPPVDAVILFGGEVPAETETQIQAASHRPKIFIVFGQREAVQKQIERGIVAWAAVQRFDPWKGNPNPQTPQEQFDRDFQILTRPTQ
jgi:hypothetical protein